MMIEILEASPDGVPLVAVCTMCGMGAVWKRPDDDPLGRSLPEWVRIHYRRSRNVDRRVTLVEVPGFPTPGLPLSGNGAPAGGFNGHPPGPPAGKLIIKTRR